MPQEQKDGILLSTSEMRERFIEKYGFEHFYGLVQQHAQFHSCSDDYCRAPKRRTTKHADGKVNTPTNKQKKSLKQQSATRSHIQCAEIADSSSNQGRERNSAGGHTYKHNKDLSWNSCLVETTHSSTHATA